MFVFTSYATAPAANGQQVAHAHSMRGTACGFRFTGSNVSFSSVRPVGSVICSACASHNPVPKGGYRK